MSLNITDLMNELAAGESARQRIPDLERQVRDASSSLDASQRHNQELELRARDRDDQITSLLERIRNAEHDRDEALMASLEVEDKLKSFRGTVDKFSSAVASALSGVGAANALLDPPKPVQSAPAAEPVKEPEGNVAGTTTAGTSTQSSGQSGSEQPSHGAGQSAGSQGQSELGPTASTEAAFASRSPTALTNPAEPQGSVGIIDTSTVDTRPWLEKEGRNNPNTDWEHKDHY